MESKQIKRYVAAALSGLIGVLLWRLFIEVDGWRMCLGAPMFGLAFYSTSQLLMEYCEQGLFNRSDETKEWCCHTCKHSNCSVTSRIADYKYGDCKKHSPSYVQGETGPKWPRVMGIDRCGDWEAKS